MKNQITQTRKWLQGTLAIVLMLVINFSAIAQNPGNPGGGIPGHHHPLPPLPPLPLPPHPPLPPPPPLPPHHPFACNAHFFHHRDSIVNGVRFFNLPGSGAATFAWDFGDGSPVSNQSHPSHTYADTGIYIVCLTITDTIRGGCTDTHCDSIHVFTPAPRCNAHFRARRDSVANELHFLTRRFGRGNPNSSATYAWDFGDGGTSTDAHPTYTYADSGTYYVCLTVSNSNAGGSCTSTYCDSVNTHLPHHPGHGPYHHHHFKLASENTGISDLTSDVLVSVFPNPMTESSTIHIENTSGTVSLNLYNSTGSIVMSKELGNGDNTISKENLSDGLYFYTDRKSVV